MPGSRSSCRAAGAALDAIAELGGARERDSDGGCGGIVGAGPVAVPAADQLPPFGGTPAFVADLAARRDRPEDHARAGHDVRPVERASARLFHRHELRIPAGKQPALPHRLRRRGLHSGDRARRRAGAGALAARRREVATELLFVRAGDPFRELWDGHIPTPAEVTARTGIATRRSAESERGIRELPGRRLQEPVRAGGRAKDSARVWWADVRGS